MKKSCITLAIALAAAASFTGCTTATYSPKKGITYRNFIFQKQFSKLETKADGSVTIEGYKSDAANLVEAAAAGVAKGLGAGVVPPTPIEP